MTSSEQETLDKEKIWYYLATIFGCVISAGMTVEILRQGEGPAILLLIFPIMGFLLLSTSAMGAMSGADGTFTSAGFGAGLMFGPVLLIPLKILSVTIPQLLETAAFSRTFARFDSMPFTPKTMMLVMFVGGMGGILIGVLTNGRAENAQ